MTTSPASPTFPAAGRIFLLLCFLLLPALAAPAQDTVMNGIRVIFVTEKKMFPCAWNKKKIDAQAAPLSASQIPRATGVVASGMAKYPPGFTNHYLDRIYIFRILGFYGYPYGGSYSRKTVYLTLDEENPVNTDKFLEERFHHEFSSILWNEHRGKLDLVKWRACNVSGFVYGEGGLNAIRSGIASMETEPGYFDIGFINRYAMTEIEQDINVMAQNLFTGGPGFWEIVDAKERIRAKVLLLIGFYYSLDPVFTEEYFRNLAN